MEFLKKLLNWLLFSGDPHDDYGYDDYHDLHDCDVDD